MLCILKVYMIFQFIFHITISPNFPDICFTSVFHKNININFKLNPDLPFIPDLIQVDIHTKKDISETETQIIDFEHHLLKKAGFPCSDALEYKVLLRGEPLIVINFTVFWGDERFVIEKFQMIVLQDFVAGYHMLEGLFGHMMLAISLDREYNVPKYSISLNFHIPNIHWSTETRRLLPGERYCTAFLTLEFNKLMILTEDSFDHFTPLKYYIFTASAEETLGKVTRVEKSYLVKIYPCRTLVDGHDSAKIYVSKSDIVVDIQLSEKAHLSVHRLSYKKHHLTFKRETDNPIFDFQGMEVKATKSLQNTIDERGGIVLLYIGQNWWPCCFELPDTLKIFRLTYIQQFGSKNALVDERLHFIDTSTQECGVFAIRLGTKSEITQCRLF